MTVKRSLLPENVERYVTSLARETPVERELRNATAQLPLALMQVSPDLAAFLALLTRLSRARRAIEIGTFTGYSAMAIAKSLPPDGKLVTCDISEEFTRIALRYWREAGVADRIDLRLGPALETLKVLKADAAGQKFDLAFIDADKTSYDAYYEACLELLRPGGLIVIDNVLWFGTVADESSRAPATTALRALNRKICEDDRVEASVLTVGDGVMLARKIASDATGRRSPRT